MAGEKVNNNAKGWGAAATTVIGAIIITFTAYSIHKATYRSPNDPLAGEAGAGSPTAARN